MTFFSTQFIVAIIFMGVLTFAIAQDIDNVDKESDVNSRSHHGETITRLPYFS